MTKARLLPVYFDPGRDAGFDAQLEALKRLARRRGGVPRRPSRSGAAARGRRGGVPAASRRGVPARWRISRRIRAPDPDPHLGVRHRCRCGTGRSSSYLRAEGVETIAPYDARADARRCAARSRVEAASCAGNSSSSTRTTPAKARRPASSSASTGGRTNASDRMSARSASRSCEKSFARAGRRRRRTSATPTRGSSRASAACRRTTASRARRSSAHSSSTSRSSARPRADPASSPAGINCLNESHFSDTTPCLAWACSSRSAGSMWGCEADIALDADHGAAPPLAGRADHDDQPLPVPDGPGGAQARADRRLSRRSRASPRTTSSSRTAATSASCRSRFATEWTLRPKVLGDRRRERDRDRRPLPARRPSRSPSSTARSAG